MIILKISFCVFPSCFIGYLGCFDDSEPRILEGRFTSSNYMTTEMCIKRCISERRIYALTEVTPYCNYNNVIKQYS